MGPEVWEWCYHCGNKYAYYDYHSCNKISYAVGGQINDPIMHTYEELQKHYQQTVATSQTNQKPYLSFYEVQEDFALDVTHVKLTIPHYNRTYAMVFTREFLGTSSLSSIYAKLCDGFAEAIALDWSVKSLLRDLVLNSNWSGPYGLIPYTPNIGRRKEIDSFPGLNEMVKYPGKHTPLEGLMMKLEHAIIRLNDKDKWTREQIADWLEALDVDIRFTPKENNDEQVG